MANNRLSKSQVEHNKNSYPAFGRDVAPHGRQSGATGFAHGAPQIPVLSSLKRTSNNYQLVTPAQAGVQ